MKTFKIEMFTEDTDGEPISETLDWYLNSVITAEFKDNTAKESVIDMLETLINKVKNVSNTEDNMVHMVIEYHKGGEWSPPQERVLGVYTDSDIAKKETINIHLRSETNKKNAREKYFSISANDAFFLENASYILQKQKIVDNYLNTKDYLETKMVSFKLNTKLYGEEK